MSDDLARRALRRKAAPPGRPGPRKAAPDLAAPDLAERGRAVTGLGWKLGLAAGLCLALAAVWFWKSPSYRAAQAYQAGLALTDSGDFDGALAQFETALRLDRTDAAAREAEADLLLRMGQTDRAARLYLDLVVLDPDRVSAHLKLAQIAIDRYDTDEARREAAEAVRLDPANAGAQAILADVAYLVATTRKDQTAAAAAVAAARALLADHPDLVTARRVVIRSLIAGATPQDALPDLDIAIAQVPGSLELEEMKLNVFSRTGDSVRGLAQMKHMHAKFPDNADIQGWLLDALAAAGDSDGVIALLRDIADRPGADRAGADPAPHLRLVDAIGQARGPEAALAELKRLAAEGGPLAGFFGLRAASTEFDMGRKDSAIAALRDSLATAGEASDQTRAARILLARMLHDTGDSTGALATVDSVLAEDPSNPEALRMRGAWLLEQRHYAEAATTLTRALDQNGQDPKTLLLLAEAHDGLGNTALAGRNFALAVEASQAGAEESLQFYRFLLRTGSPEVADIVLQKAAGQDPGNVALLAGAFDAALAQADLPRARQTLALLQAVDSDAGRAAALQAERAIAARN